MAVASKPDSRTRAFLSALVGIVVAMVTMIALSGLYVSIFYLIFRKAHGDITFENFIDLIADTPLRVLDSKPLVALDLGFNIFMGWAVYCVAAQCAQMISKKYSGLSIVCVFAVISVLIDIKEFSGWNGDQFLSFCEDIVQLGTMLITWRRWSPRARA